MCIYVNACACDVYVYMQDVKVAYADGDVMLLYSQWFYYFSIDSSTVYVRMNLCACA